MTIEANTSVLKNDEAKELIQLCRSGRLYEIDEWIAAGRSLVVPPEIRKTPLQVAVETGFHSLVLLLARNERLQIVKDGALAVAVLLKDRDLVDLLLQCGAEVTGVPFVQVLRTWDPYLIRCFLERGADAVTDAPFALAVAGKVRTALRPFVDYRNAHPNLADTLQAQVDRALRYFCHEGDLKWVSLLMWAGANPRSSGPSLDNEDDPELYVTAMEEACFSGNVDVFMRLRPDPARDDLQGLLQSAVMFGSAAMVEKLMDIGAVPNPKANGGSAALDSIFGRMRFEGYRPWERYQRRGKYSVSKPLEMIRILVARGAVWCPDSRDDLKAVRKILFEHEPDVTLEVLKLIVGHNAASRETLRALLDSPRIREHLAKEAWWMGRLKLTDLIEDPKERMKRLRPRTVADIPKYLLAQHNRDELYQQVWQEPMQLLAKRYGVSDVALAKTCRKLLIPLPGRGYWAKKAAGRRVPPRPKLPG